MIREKTKEKSLKVIYLLPFVVRNVNLTKSGSSPYADVAEFYEVCRDEANLHIASLSMDYGAIRTHASCHANPVPGA